MSLNNIALRYCSFIINIDIRHRIQCRHATHANLGHTLQQLACRGCIQGYRPTCKSTSPCVWYEYAFDTLTRRVQGIKVKSLYPCRSCIVLFIVSERLVEESTNTPTIVIMYAFAHVCMYAFGGGSDLSGRFCIP